jgi:deoxyribodipyrimidine photo-lyase
MWFRRDLRLSDQPALAAACGEGAVLPLFVLDPAFAAASGCPRGAAVIDALAALDRATGGALVVRSGDPLAIVPAVASEIDADTVFVSKDFGPYGRRRDAAVAEALRAAGRRLRGVGSPYAVEPGSVLKPDATPYAVYTPFSKRWRSVGWVDPIAAPADPDWIEAGGDPLSVHGSGHGADRAAGFGEISEAAAAERWHRFRTTALDSYASDRDLPGVDGTSRLSAQLKFGTVHPRQLLAEIDATGGGGEVFTKELAWRDFYADVLHHQPRTAWENLDRRFDRIAVDTGAAATARFEAWCAGRTGFPIVDAGMRQLLATGWVHNRVRMIVASFLVKDLHLPWQWGARHFLHHLVDGDLASNNHGWQWAAGSGTDAAPYFRVFNPNAQQERWDPDGAYVARWIPELGTAAYPAPIVDHAAERDEALARYGAIRAVPPADAVP